MENAWDLAANGPTLKKERNALKRDHAVSVPIDRRPHPNTSTAASPEGIRSLVFPPKTWDATSWFAFGVNSCQAPFREVGQSQIGDGFAGPCGLPPKCPFHQIRDFGHLSLAPSANSVSQYVPPSWQLWHRTKWKSVVALPPYCCENACTCANLCTMKTWAESDRCGAEESMRGRCCFFPSDEHIDRHVCSKTARWYSRYLRRRRQCNGCHVRVIPSIAKTSPSISKEKCLSGFHFPSFRSFLTKPVWCKGGVVWMWSLSDSQFKSTYWRSCGGCWFWNEAHNLSMRAFNAWRTQSSCRALCACGFVCTPCRIAEMFCPCMHGF